MHPIFDKLTRTLSGDFMRRDDCCGGNGGEPAIQCCKPNEASRRATAQAKENQPVRNNVVMRDCKFYNHTGVGFTIEAPQRITEREAETLIDLLYGEKK